MVKTFKSMINVSRSGGGGGGGDPTPLLEFVTYASTGDGFFATDVLETSLDLTFPAAGMHLICLSGGAGSTNGSGQQIMNMVSLKRGTRDVPYVDIGSNWIVGDFESVRWLLLNVPNPGTYTFTFAAVVTQIYRASIAAWKMTDLDFANPTRYVHTGESAESITVAEGDAVASVIIGRGATSLADPVSVGLSGLATVDVVPEPYEVGDDDYFGLYSEDGLAASTLSLTHDTDGTNTGRAFLASIQFSSIPAS